VAQHESLFTFDLIFTFYGTANPLMRMVQSLKYTRTE